jgi:hypothetical protein
LFVDPELRLERTPELRGRPAHRFASARNIVASARNIRFPSARHIVSARNISMAVLGLFALMGVVAASFTLSKSNRPSESGMASIVLPAAPALPVSTKPSLSRDVAPNQMTTSVPAPVRPSDAVPSTPVNDATIAAKPAPLQETAAIQPRRLRPRHPAPASTHNNCSDCPPIDAADLPPLGPSAGLN